MPIKKFLGERPNTYKIHQYSLNIARKTASLSLHSLLIEESIKASLGHLNQKVGKYVYIPICLIKLGTQDFASDIR